MANREPALDPVVQHLEQVPDIGREVPEDGEPVPFASLRQALPRMEGVSGRHEHRLELERVLDAVGIGNRDGLQPRVVEVHAHPCGGLLVEAAVAAHADVDDGNALV